MAMGARNRAPTQLRDSYLRLSRYVIIVRKALTAAVNKARRHAWAQGIARHGGLPPVRVADRTLEGVTCIRLDATVVTAHTCTRSWQSRTSRATTC